MGTTKKGAQTERKEDTLGSKQVSGANPVETLLQSLIQAAGKVDASVLHIYSNYKSRTCYFEVAGKLTLTGKKLTDRVLEELVEFVKKSAHLESSELNQAQTGELKIQDVTLGVTLIQNLENKNSHLTLNLSGTLRSKSFEDLGFWGKSLEDLESGLDSRKGVVVVDSKDQYALRSFIGSALSYLNEGGGASSMSFDSSGLSGLDPHNNDRIFTKIDSSTISLAQRALRSNPATVIFLDRVSESSLSLSLEQSRAGKLVFITTSEGSSSSSLRSVLACSSDYVELLAELRLVVSLSPVQTVSSSNGNHKLDANSVTQLEDFFGIDLPESWKSIYSHAGIKSPEELLHLEFPVASEYGGVTNLVEVLAPTDYLARTLIRNPNLDTTTISHLAVKSGMVSKREDGLIKALRKEVDLADVIDTCR